MNHYQLELSPGGEVTQTTVGLGEGVTVVDAVHDLYSTTQRKIFWGHLSSVVFSENVLFNDIDGALDVISRYSEIRPTPWIFATDENFRDLLNTLPTLGVNIIYSFLANHSKVIIRAQSLNRLNTIDL
ncbi:Ger(x)C family spore germination protein [Piscibacillus salipiscarius]|uniref:Ger(x)C family spore germination protein n=1 Tax=Piscibacillus salipiscarius TaxID=299480 RepID=UPI0024370B92|nr:hypothetical protein [Piscibacillus salipiscarius]